MAAKPAIDRDLDIKKDRGGGSIGEDVCGYRIILFGFSFPSKIPNPI